MELNLIEDYLFAWRHALLENELWQCLWRLNSFRETFGKIYSFSRSKKLHENVKNKSRDQRKEIGDNN